METHVCSRGHTWSGLAGSANAGEGPRCPTCGEAALSSSAPAEQVTVALDQETLPPTVIPPLVAPLAGHVPVTQPSAARPSGPPIDCLGEYEIVRELARGGMGVVYQARSRALDRMVAIKMVLGGGAAGEEAVRRFRVEAEAIARLEHPNIVRIYDLEWHEGQLFLVLEFVDGTNLARTIGGRPQPFRAAAQVVETLARAIGYAHRRGVVHRDLTPANVLLSRPATWTVDDTCAVEALPPLDACVPKITDFGLAKRLDDSSQQTRTGVIMGTPSYMAPEQASGLSQFVGPSCDIYALGAILYELLCGRPPFLGETALATLDQVVNSEPVPPRRLQPQVPRDLETICLKCLDKRPAQRFTNADELADDLARFLAGEPIRARPLSGPMRALRWSKRRPAAAALVLVSVMAAAILLAGGWWTVAAVSYERDRAEANFRQALRAIDGMLTEVSEEELAFEPRMDEKRKTLLRKALALYREFLDERGQDARLQWETAHALRRVGDIERGLGNYADSGRAYRDAIQLFSRLDDRRGPGESAASALVYCHNFLGEAYRLSGQSASAEQSYREAIRVAEASARKSVDDDALTRELVRSRYNLGILYRERGRLRDAEREMNGALGQARGMPGKTSEDSFSQESARIHLNLGTVLRGLGKPNEAVEHYQRAIALLQRLVDQTPARPDYRFELAVATANLGNVDLARSEPSLAAEHYREAATRLERLVTDHPSVPAPRQELANTYNGLATALAKSNSLPAAAETWSKAARLFGELVDRYPQVPAYRADLGMALGNLAWALAEQQQLEESRTQLQAGIEHLQAALESNPSHPEYGLSLRSQIRELGRVSLDLNDIEQGIAAAHQLVGAPGCTANDRLAAGCLLLRAAKANEGTEDSPEIARLAGQWIVAAATSGVDDAALKDFARGLVSELLLRYPDLSAAHAVLHDPAPLVEKTAAAP